MSAPRLPDAPGSYDIGYMSRLLSSLRTYFVQLEAVRHINIASCNISLDTLPTTDTGARDGDVWVDGNVLKVAGLAGGGGAVTTTNAVTFNNSGTGAASGTSFNGGVAITVSYNTIGAAASSHTHPWGNITGTPTTVAGYGITDLQSVVGAWFLPLYGGFMTGPITMTPSGPGNGLTINQNTSGDRIESLITSTSETGFYAANANYSGMLGIDANGAFVGGMAGSPLFFRTDQLNRGNVNALGAWTINAPDSGAHAINGAVGFNTTPTVSGTSVSLATHNHSGVYQPLDADLTAIASLAGTGGLLRKTAANTWSLDTATYLTGNQSITFSGDASGTGSTAVTLTLATVNSNVGSFGSASVVPVVTVNGKGLVTAVSTATITPTAIGSVAKAGDTMTGTLRVDGTGAHITVGAFDPSSWSSAYKAVEIGRAGNSIFAKSSGAQTLITTNAYWNGTDWKYANNDYASNLELTGSGALAFHTAASGTAGNNISFSQKMFVDTNTANFTVPVRSTDTSTGAYGQLDSWDAGGGVRPTSIYVSNDGSVGPEIVRLGSGGAHWIKFSASQNASSDANALDDYEEGAWTPVSGTTNITVSTIHHAGYIKVGQFVYAYCYVELNNTTGSAQSFINMQGLPFTNQSGAYPMAYPHYAANGSQNASANYSYINSGSTQWFTSFTTNAIVTGISGYMWTCHYKASA